MADVPLWIWGVLAGLLALSGFFSSAETALFSLTERERKASAPSVRRLIARPSQLLISVLLLNLLVNVLYFAYAGRLQAGESGVRDAVVGLGVLVGLLVFGEILPKTLGLRARQRVAHFAAPILTAVVWGLAPITRPLRVVLDAIHRVLEGWIPAERGITADVLERVMERGEEEGVLLAEEADLLAEVIELDEIRVREIMTPRVDVLFLDVSGDGREEIVARALEERIPWLPVVDGGPDHVLGLVPLRELLRHEQRAIAQMVMPVKFVPEVASALDLLYSLREDRASEAVVIDEWGGTAGIVTAEDVFEELVGDLRAEDEDRVAPVEVLGGGHYRVAGGLSIRDWNDALGLDIVPSEFETVGGFVTALLGRMPRVGDRVRAGDLEMKVHEMRGRRIATVDIGIDRGEDRR